MKKLYTALIVLTLLFFVPVLICSAKLVINLSNNRDEAPQTSRHQQNQRPSFIERRLRNNRAEAQQGINNAEKAQIRHERSRGLHGARNRFAKAQLVSDPINEDADFSTVPELTFEDIEDEFPFLLPEALLFQSTEHQPTVDWKNDSLDYYYTNEDEVNNDTSIQSTVEPEWSATSSTTGQVDIVTRFLRIIENQHLLGENCTAGTDLNLGEGVVDQYAQERFRLEANLAVNRANMLTRLWKYAPEIMSASEYLLHASVLSMVEFDEDIFAAGNCYDKLQYRDRWLYCPFAHRLQDEDGILVKDLAVEYKYLTNSSEWFYKARKNAERRIASYDQQFSKSE